MSMHVPSIVQIDVQMLDQTVVRIDVSTRRSTKLAVDVLCTSRNDDAAAVVDVELEHRQKYELICFAHLTFLSLAYVSIIPRQVDCFRPSSSSLCSFDRDFARRKHGFAPRRDHLFGVAPVAAFARLLQRGRVVPVSLELTAVQTARLFSCRFPPCVYIMPTVWFHFRPRVNNSKHIQGDKTWRF